MKPSNSEKCCEICRFTNKMKWTSICGNTDCECHKAKEERFLGKGIKETKDEAQRFIDSELSTSTSTKDVEDFAKKLAEELSDDVDWSEWEKFGEQRYWDFSQDETEEFKQIIQSLLDNTRKEERERLRKGVEDVVFSIASEPMDLCENSNKFKEKVLGKLKDLSDILTLL